MFFALAKICAQSIETAVPDTSVIEVPKAFSPNGDGINDVLYIKASNVSNFDFELFNRWGQIIYKTTDARVGWKGITPKGKRYPKGTYYYLINYNDNFKKDKTQTGFIELR
jgi:gliding motility-associated-like protein